MRKGVVAVGLALLAWLVLWSVVMVEVASGHKRSLYATLHTERGERVMARVICENPEKWSVEPTACEH